MADTTRITGQGVSGGSDSIALTAMNYTEDEDQLVDDAASEPAEMAIEELRQKANERQLTLRGLCAGLAIGLLSCFSNSYFGVSFSVISQVL